MLCGTLVAVVVGGGGWGVNTCRALMCFQMCPIVMRLGWVDSLLSQICSLERNLRTSKVSAGFS